MNRFDPTGGYPEIVARHTGDALLLPVQDAEPWQVARSCVCRLYRLKRGVPDWQDVVQTAAVLNPPVKLSQATASRALQWFRERAGVTP